MAFSLTWLAEVLEAAGLKVAEVPDWRTRGRAEMGPVKGVICHHTAGPKRGNMPSLGVITNGRPDLPGPLAQLGLGRDGTFYVVAAGRANHAGAGVWQGLTNGNQNFIGIEAENMGTAEDPWPAVQMDAYYRGVAAILRKVEAPVSMCAGHKEYALPHGRKTDPSFDMDAFRSQVGRFMTGAALPLLIPAHDDAGRPTVRRGSSGQDVIALQHKLGATESGTFDAGLEAQVRQFQRDHQLVPFGIVVPTPGAALG